MRKRDQYIIIIGMILAILGFSTVSYQFAKWKYGTGAYYSPSDNIKPIFVDTNYTALVVRYPEGDTMMVHKGKETPKPIPAPQVLEQIDSPVVGTIYTIYELWYDSKNPFDKSGILRIKIVAVKDGYIKYREVGTSWSHLVFSESIEVFNWSRKPPR